MRMQAACLILMLLGLAWAENPAEAAAALTTNVPAPCDNAVTVRSTAEADAFLATGSKDMVAPEAAHSGEIHCRGYGDALSVHDFTAEQPFNVNSI